MSEKLTDAQVEEACARYAHATNREFCLAVGIRQEPWEDLAPSARDVVHNIVEFVLAGGTAESKHVVWVQMMRKQGYSVGAVVDHLERRHPMMVPWKDLPLGQRMKDELQVQAVQLLAIALGHSRWPLDVRTFTVERPPESGKEHGT